MYNWYIDYIRILFFQSSIIYLMFIAETYFYKYFEKDIVTLSKC